MQVIAPTNAEVLPVLPEPESLELKKHLKQVGEEGSKRVGLLSRGRAPEKRGFSFWGGGVNLRRRAI